MFEIDPTMFGRQTALARFERTLVLKGAGGGTRDPELSQFSNGASNIFAGTKMQPSALSVLPCIRT